MQRRCGGVRRLLTFSMTAALLATACGGASEPQILDAVASDEGDTPTSLAFALVATETTDAAPGEAGASEAMPADMADAALFSCSDAIVGFFAATPHETPEDIAAIEAQFTAGDIGLVDACAGLDDLEALGVTETEMTSHMLSQVPPESLPALLQLAEVFRG